MISDWQVGLFGFARWFRCDFRLGEEVGVPELYGF